MNSQTITIQIKLLKSALLAIFKIPCNFKPLFDLFGIRTCETFKRFGPGSFDKHRKITDF